MLRTGRLVQFAAMLLVAGGLVGGAVPAQAVSCVSGEMCIWQDIHYMNTRGTFSGDNSNWGQDFTPSGFWQDSVSSAFSDISSHNLAMFQDINGSYGQNFESSTPNFVVCLSYNVDSSDSSNFRNIPDPQDGFFTDLTFNDEASSDVVFQGDSSWCDSVD